MRPPSFMYVANLDFICFFSSCRPCRPQHHSQRQYVLSDAPAHRTICREEPVLEGKVTCGVRSETSGQSWLSNTVATNAFYQSVTDRIISRHYVESGQIASLSRWLLVDAPAE